MCYIYLRDMGCTCIMFKCTQKKTKECGTMEPLYCKVKILVNIHNTYLRTEGHTRCQLIAFCFARFLLTGSLVIHLMILVGVWCSGKDCKKLLYRLSSTLMK
jgi:hypothetical protein